jgi:mannose-6-phosphate isomerase-like protein (cupin superfamily)
MTDRIDQGPSPYVMNIMDKTLQNEDFRVTLWTGVNMQVTAMAILPGQDIGLEVHAMHDQFLRIEQGEATVYMGAEKDNLQSWTVKDDDAIFVPAGSWHNIVNTGTEKLKLYSIYAPPEHPHGTVHQTRADSDRDEED